MKMSLLMNKEILKAYTKEIKELEAANTNNYKLIGYRLYDIKYNNYLYGSKYDNITEYALQEFGYEKSQTYNLINVYVKFFNGELLMDSENKYNKYSITQLVNMLDMSEEKLDKCNPEMTVSNIKMIKITNFSIRMENESIENELKMENKKNEDVINNIIPYKNEERTEEKTITTIVTELPKEQQKENKTIVVDVKTEQNDDYAINQDIALEAQQDYYKNKYHEALEEIQVLQENIANVNKKIQDYKIKVKEVSDTLVYFHDELLFINADLKNQKIDKYMKEFFEFVFNGKLPKKIYFMKHVI